MGYEDDFAPPAADNPEGFWENLRFVEINDQILAVFNGAWDCPPVVPPGWETSAQVQPLQTQAAQLVESFSNKEYWGWKDPRTCLTLPFWQPLLPELKVIICLRNPLSVVASLRKRNEYMSDQFGFNLWETYYERLLTTIQEGNYLITHYDSYFYNPQAEIRRLIRFLDLNVSDKIIELASQTISSNLRHHYISINHTLKSDISINSKKLYWNMCGNAGPIYQTLLLKHDKVEPNLWQQQKSAAGIEYPKQELFRWSHSAADEINKQPEKFRGFYFDNGISFPEIIWLIWLKQEEETPDRWPTPQEIDGDNSFLAWLNQPVDTGEPVITNLALAIHRLRSDLQTAFPNPVDEQRGGFAEWFVQNAASQCGLDYFTFVLPVTESLIQTYQTQRATLHAELASAKAMLQTREKELQMLEKQLQAIRTSTTWRILSKARLV